MVKISLMVDFVIFLFVVVVSGCITRLSTENIVSTEKKRLRLLSGRGARLFDRTPNLRFREIC